MKKIIIIVVAVLLLVGGAVGATLYFTGALSEEPVDEEAVESEDGEGEDDAEGEGKSKKKKKKRKKGEDLETFYFHLQPEFVVNFGAKARPRYLMLEVSASTYDEKVLEIMDTHMPEIRNDLILLYGSQDSKILSTTEGKNELRAKTLEAIQKVLLKHYDDEGIEDVFFTRFVMQ